MDSMTVEDLIEYKVASRTVIMGIFRGTREPKDPFIRRVAKRLYPKDADAQQRLIKELQVARADSEPVRTGRVLDDLRSGAIEQITYTSQQYEPVSGCEDCF